MSALSEVSLLMGQRAADLEKARDIFTSESRDFVVKILQGARKLRSEPWVQGRVRIDLPREITTEGKAGGYLPSQFALARCELRFRKGTQFRVVAEASFGIEYDEPGGSFVWRIVLVPEARYQRIDDHIWKHTVAAGGGSRPGAAHRQRSNSICFVSRPLDGSLNAEIAFNDVKDVLEYLLSTDSVLAEAVGLDPEDDT